MLKAVRCGNGPNAIINKETELIIVAVAVLSEKLYGKTIPVVDHTDQDPIETIHTGDWIRVNGEEGTIEIIRRK